MIWIKSRERLTTLRSCIFFFQSPCKYPRFLQIPLIWPSFISPPEKFERPPRGPSLTGKITHDGESSIHQQLFWSGMSLYFPSTTGREDKSPFSRDGRERFHKLDEGFMELLAINP